MSGVLRSIGFLAILAVALPSPAAFARDDRPGPATPARGPVYGVAAVVGTFRGNDNEAVGGFSRTQFGSSGVVGARLLMQGAERGPRAPFLRLELEGSRFETDLTELDSEFGRLSATVFFWNLKYGRAPNPRRSASAYFGFGLGFMTSSFSNGPYFRDIEEEDGVTAVLDTSTAFAMNLGLGLELVPLPQVSIDVEARVAGGAPRSTLTLTGPGGDASVPGFDQMYPIGLQLVAALNLWFGNR